MKTYVLYHQNCADGFGAAWSFWQKFGSDANYIAVSHGLPLPQMEAGAMLYIADFSFDRKTTMKLQAIHPQMQVLDHHYSASRELAELDFVKIDISKSGAVLAWEHLNPGLPVPKLLLYIQDRDLWQWNLPYSREISSLIGASDFDFFGWNALSEKLEFHFDETLATGKLITKSNDRVIESICNTARLIEFEGYRVPCVNTSAFHSDAGHRLLQKFPDAPFSLSFYVDALNRLKCSFRSRGDFDVTALAEKYRGGGHRAAAGGFLESVP